MRASTQSRRRSASWADLPFPLIRHAPSQEQLRTIPHPNANWWKTFCVLESEQAHGGPVVTWLANQLEAYLTPMPMVRANLPLPD
ncbi:hypothetical protein D893_00326 [Thioalkalivibrio sp. ALE21]|nr:hypothetical protein D893_00326 [Thioalkalivibrio sp. ALE21]